MIARALALAVLAAVSSTTAFAQPGPAGTVRFYHTDALGSVRAVTDAQGNPIARHDYFAFGEEPASAPNPAPQRFTGQQRDPESGMDYFQARYYMPALGRFTTVDPESRSEDAIREPQRWNRYAYVSNNPLRKIDPNGRYEEDVHYHLTRVLAMAAGFTTKSAEIIAQANQRVDTHPITEPFRDLQARSDFHFTTEGRRQQVWDFAMSARSAEGVGVYLHLQQDSFSHAGFSPGAGHLFKGHGPDKTYNDIPKANEMAHDTYARLTDAMFRIQRSGVVVPWAKIAGFVDRFNAERDLQKKYGILAELAEFIEDYKK